MTRRSTTRRALTLIETIAAVTIIALAVPPMLTLITDAAEVRAAGLTAQRATWLATGLLEHIAADAASDDDNLGFDAFADTDAYLNTPATGLRDRAADIIDFYESFGLGWDVVIGPLVGPTGVATGDPEADVFRSVRVEASWAGRRGVSTVRVARLVAAR